MNDLNDDLGRVSKEIMLKEPFYGLFLMMLNKKWDKKVETAGVSTDGLNYFIYINPDFWMSLPRNKKIGLLKHELKHIAFFHLTDFSHQTNKVISNIAMDLHINQMEEPDNLPEGGMLLSSFPDLNLKAYQGSNYYYDELMKQAKSSSSVKMCIKASENGESEVDTGNGEVKLPNHDTWGETEIGEANKRLIETQLKGIINEVAEATKKSRGTIPGEFADILEKINVIEEAKFNWKGYLRRFAGGSTKYYTKKSRRKLSRRFPENPGIKIKQHKHILVGVDTSASVSNTELKEFLNEIYHINKTGSEVTIIQCDTAVRSIKKFNPREDLQIVGRGGTDFQPVIDYFNDNSNKYTCLVYVTDGEAPPPTGVKGKLLWVLSSTSTMNNKLPGPTIKLN